MKILQINTVVNTGSTGRITEDIGNKIISNGWESYIAYGRYGNKSNSHTIKIGSKFDTIIHGLITRFCGKHGFGSKNATKKFIEKIEKLKPDLIHLHNLHGYYININFLFNYLSQIDVPVVWTLHDCWAYTGHCAYYTFENCQKWRFHCESCPQLDKYPKSFIDNSYNNFDIKKKLFNSKSNLVIVPVSKWLNNEIRSSFLQNKIIHQIYNGIDVNLFHYQDFSKLKLKLNLANKFIILGVANIWDERKGLNNFIRLSKSLLADEVIILIGLSKKQIKKLPQNIIGLSRTENLDILIQYYSMANVFYNSSIEETFGLTIAESMACGTPAIVHNSTACPELVSDNTGFVLKSENLDDFRNALNQIKINGKEFYLNLCRDRIVDYFDQKKMCLNYISLYQSFF